MPASLYFLEILFSIKANLFTDRTFKAHHPYINSKLKF